MAVEAGGIGARLRAGREKLGLTVLQVAERIHTDPKIVEAIEADNYDALGAPVYARGHIRHYAELVGEPTGELISQYSNLSKVAQPDLTRIVKAPSGGDSNKLVAPALLVIAVFAVAGAVWWVSALSKKKPQLSETHVVGEEAPAPAPESPPDATAVQAQPAAPPAPGAGEAQGRSSTSLAGNTVSGRIGTAASSGAASPPGASNASGSAAPGGGAAMQGRPGAAASAQRASAVPGHSGGTANSGRSPAQGGATTGTSVPATAQRRTAAAPTPAHAAAAPPSPPSRNQAQVTLRYSADSWTEVYDASGARLFYDVGAAHSVQAIVGTPPIRVVLGNASGVAVEFNGHNASVAKLARPDGSVQFSINRSGRVVRAKPVGDGG